MGRMERLRRAPDAHKYTELFIDLPDVVALNRLLCLLSHRGPQAIPILYAGDNHRLGLKDLLGRLPSVRIRTVAESKDPVEGSCARPLR